MNGTVAFLASCNMHVPHFFKMERDVGLRFTSCKNIECDENRVEKDVARNSVGSCRNRGASSVSQSINGLAACLICCDVHVFQRRTKNSVTNADLTTTETTRAAIIIAFKTFKTSVCKGCPILSSS